MIALEVSLLMQIVLRVIRVEIAPPVFQLISKAERSVDVMEVMHVRETLTLRQRCTLPLVI